MKVTCYDNIKTKSYTTSSLILDITNKVKRYSQIPVGYIEKDNLVNVSFKEMNLWERFKFLVTNKL